MDLNEYLPQQPCICINFRRLVQKITDCYDRALQPAGVSVNQYSLLVNLARNEGCGTGELAQLVRLEKSTLVRTLQPLIRDKLIINKPEGNKRLNKLYLTSAGKKTLIKALPLWTQAQAEISGKMGKSSQEIIDIFSRFNSPD